MIDIRYHVYSLAAVFFALAVGVVFGTTFAKTAPSSESERRTILRYENAMRILKREIEKAAEGAAQYQALARSNEEFCRALLPMVARGKLAWRNVAIIQTGDYDDLTGSIKRTLELAGAQVVSVTTFNREFPVRDDRKILSVLAECGVNAEGSVRKAREKLFRIIAGSVIAGTHSYILPKLESCGVARFTGSYDSQKKVRLIVLVGGSASQAGNTADEIDSRLIDALEPWGVTIVGCERSDAGSSYVPIWQKAGIATVDNADSAIGQIILLYALNGEKANFGIKDTADRLIPQTLEGS